VNGIEVYTFGDSDGGVVYHDDIDITSFLHIGVNTITVVINSSGDTIGNSWLWAIAHYYLNIEKKPPLTFPIPAPDKLDDILDDITDKIRESDPFKDNPWVKRAREYDPFSNDPFVNPEVGPGTGLPYFGPEIKKIIEWVLT